MRSRALAAGALLWICASGVLRAAEPWYEAYAAGLRAMASEQWTQAEAKLRQAMKDGPKEGRNTRAYGTRFIIYIPSYHLAVVHYRQGRSREAEAEMRQVEAARLVSRGDPEFARMSEILQAGATAAGAQTPPPTAPTIPQPNHAQQEAEASLRSARDFLQEGNLEDARRAFEAARSKDPTSPALVSLAETLATREAERRAKAEMDTRARGEQQAREAAGGQKRADLERLLDAAATQLAAKRPLLAREAALKAKGLGILDPRIEEVLGAADFALGVEELARLVARQDWQAAQRRARQLATRSPNDPELVRLGVAIEKALAAPHDADPEIAGLRAFYAGRYEAAIDALVPLADGPSPTAKTLYYLACSRVALAMLKDSAGQPKDLAKARASVQQMQRLGLKPPADADWISPRVRHALDVEHP